MRGLTIFISGLICLICISINCFATTYYVNPGQSIQDAIDSSTHGDTVIVSPGTYYENISFNGKNIVLTSTDPDSSAVVAATKIDGSTPANPDYGSVVIFDGSETVTCVLAGFTIQNGSGTNRWSSVYGGGVFGSWCKATIQNNIITGNSVTGYGGGLSSCNGTIQDNTITDNFANEDGGGLFGCNGNVENNIISENSAISGVGGGLSACDGIIQNNTITGNSAYYYGGGLYSCSGTIQNNTISENVSDLGGGLYSCNGTIQNNIISGNDANEGGGWIFAMAQSRTTESQKTRRMETVAGCGIATAQSGTMLSAETRLV
jgi:hypothetical protein